MVAYRVVMTWMPAILRRETLSVLHSYHRFLLFLDFKSLFCFGATLLYHRRFYEKLWKENDRTTLFAPSNHYIIELSKSIIIHNQIVPSNTLSLIIPMWYIVQLNIMSFMTNKSILFFMIFCEYKSWEYAALVKY